MPRRHAPKTLRRCSMLALARHWDLICYSAHSIKEMNALLENDDFLKFQGPFHKMPSIILEDLMEVIRSTRSLNRKFLHLLILEQLQSLNLSLGVGEVYYGLHFLPRCKRLRNLNLSYLRHVEPTQLMKLVPHLTTIVFLNLMMTNTNDAFLEMIGLHCPNLAELNLTSTMITDDGMFSLCGVGMNENVPRCQKLQRLVITETRVTWIGALTILQHLPNLIDFDFDKIFQVFEHLDPKSVVSSTGHPSFKIKHLYSTAPCVRGDSIDAAAALCPNIQNLSVTNAWIDNDTFYKFMQFEKLKSLTLVNSEGLTIDFEEGVLPILQVIGATLENLILNKFKSLNLVSLGLSCPKLKKVALSGVKEYTYSFHVEGLFPQLTILEFWCEDTETPTDHALAQLLTSSVWLESLLIKNSDDFDEKLFRKIFQVNPMKKLGRLILVECNHVELWMLKDLLARDNDLAVLRIWSCPQIQSEERQQLQNLIASQNFNVYLEWFK